MDQVSRPLLIALVATVALAAVWLVALRPKPAAVADAPLPATKPVEQGAPTAAASAPASTQAAGDPVAPARGAEPTRGDTRRERAVLSQVRDGKVVVMLFFSAHSADDLATRGAVRDLDRRKGKVKVHVIPISRVGDYGSITRGVKIAQSPTTLIIGHKGRTRTIVGLSEPKELEQAVGDAVARR